MLTTLLAVPALSLVAALMAPTPKWVVKPDSVQLAPGQRQAFCVFVQFPSGVTALPAGEAARWPWCGGIYTQTVPASLRVVNRQQQRQADQMWAAL